MFNDVWNHLRRNVFSPKVDPAKVEEHLQRVRKKLPIPVFWLVGKSQSGKTSIVRSLTGSSRAEIGNGFRPCTRTAQVYSFPAEEDCLVRFLDTRGLGEAGYDPQEDMTFCAAQAHLMMVVVKAMDHAQQAVLDVVRAARRSHPDWPIIVVQTSLHEGYPPGTKHLDPYPYDKPDLPPEVPRDLARSLAAQRVVFAPYASHFVPVDLTLPEDGFAPEHYGIESLWSTIETVLPLGLRAVLEQHDDLRGPLRDAYFHTARPHIAAYAAAAGAAAAVPVPFVDIPLVIAIQGKMAHTIASIYEQPMNAKLLGEITGSLGLGMIARMGGRELVKLVPGVGMATASGYAAATTYALGCTLCAYFSHVRSGDVPDTEKIRALYADAMTRGRDRLSEYVSHAGKPPRNGSGGPK